jgi:hypothetical protein
MTDADLQSILEYCGACSLGKGLMEEPPESCCTDLPAVVRELIEARAAIEAAKRNLQAWLAWHRAGLVGPHHADAVITATEQWISDPLRAGRAFLGGDDAE